VITTSSSNVEIIDLDTIDVSNLNRQFLFRSQHVGMPKCVVARKVCVSIFCDMNSCVQYNVSSIGYFI